MGPKTSWGCIGNLFFSNFRKLWTAHDVMVLTKGQVLWVLRYWLGRCSFLCGQIFYFDFEENKILIHRQIIDPTPRSIFQVSMWSSYIVRRPQNFKKSSTLLNFVRSKTNGNFFSNICGLLRMYELYPDF